MYNTGGDDQRITVGEKYFFDLADALKRTTWFCIHLDRFQCS